MNNAELINSLKDAEMYMIYVAPSCYASCEAIKAIRTAADLIEAQQKALDACAKQLADMAAKVPKEGEWIDDNGANVPLDRDGYTTGMCRCSVCGDWLIASDEYEVRGRYCPNCGAKMKGEQE